MIEQGDRWILPFRGLTVTRLLVDFEFGLNLGDEGAAARIGCGATLGRVRGDVEPAVLDPATQDVAAGLALFNTEAKSAVAFKSGALRLVFGDGHLLRVTPDERYEAWSATGRTACWSSAGLAVA